MPATPFIYRPVNVRDNSSGRVHTRVREELDDGTLRRYLTDERCQADQAGAYHEAGPTELSECEPGAFCQFCFPASVL